MRSLPGSYAPQDGVKEVDVCSLLIRDSQGGITGLRKGLVDGKRSEIRRRELKKKRIF